MKPRPGSRPAHEQHSPFSRSAQASVIQSVTGGGRDKVIRDSAIQDAAEV
jgi:hypothetical protein